VKTFAKSIRAKMIVGDVPLNVNFALCKPALWRGCRVFTKLDEYYVFITMKYQNTNSVH